MTSTRVLDLLNPLHTPTPCPHLSAFDQTHPGLSVDILSGKFHEISQQLFWS